jgi:hypothetical protein
VVVVGRISSHDYNGNTVLLARLVVLVRYAEHIISETTMLSQHTPAIFLKQDMILALLKTPRIGGWGAVKRGWKINILEKRDKLIEEQVTGK